jgi:hypothetical protein
MAPEYHIFDLGARNLPDQHRHSVSFCSTLRAVPEFTPPPREAA